MVIHQTLHGYRNGHNMLSSSIHLSAKDDDLMKVLSDWSEYSGGTDGNSSYITAYPLPESGLYAVGKTWYASEKERPGCVWTHTLLLDVAHLDASFDFRCLMSLFRKPSDDDYESYSEQIQLSGNESDYKSLTVDASELVRLMFLYVHLLQPSDDVFFVERQSEYYQMLCLTFMQHLPVSILKERSFSSGSDAGRMLYGRPFSLQFTSGLGMCLSNAQEVNNLNLSNFDDGIVAICTALADGKQDISQFIRLFEDDINGDVAKLCAVGKLYAYMDKKQPSITINVVIQTIVDAFPNIGDGINIKTAFLGKKVSSLFAKETDVLVALGTTLSDKCFDFNNINFLQRANDVAVGDTREQYYSLLECLVESENLNAYGQSIIKDSINHLTIQDYAVLIADHWNTYLSLVSVAPQMLSNGLWVNLDNGKFSDTYEVFSKNIISNFSSWDKLFLRILYQQFPVSSCVWDGIRMNVTSIVDDVMEYLNVSVKYELDERLRNYVSNNIRGVSSYLSSRLSVSKVAKQFILSEIDPQNLEVSNTESSSWQIVCDSIDCSSHSECIFLFILSYNWKDKYSLQYLKKAYYPIYKLLQNSKLEWYLWEKIAKYTESLFLWQEWDKCKKLRKGVVRYLKGAGFSKDILNSFTPEKDLNDELMKIWD